jgi:dihydrofolate reductase
MSSPPSTSLITQDANEGGTVSKLRFQISISLDGFVAGPNQSEENPIGEGGMQLHQWVFALPAWRGTHGEDGGEESVSNEVFAEITANIGATVMGRNMFGGSGSWEDHPWDGWWGEDPPFHTPVFVVTSHPREPKVMDGGTTFHFVTDGVESALAQAKAAAGDKDVTLGGGANVAQQYLRAGLVDEMMLNIVPVLLGDGERLLDGLGGVDLGMQCVRAIQAPGVTHLTYRKAT